MSEQRIVTCLCCHRTGEAEMCSGIEHRGADELTTAVPVEWQICSYCGSDMVEEVKS